MSTKIAFVGAGSISEALIAGLLSANLYKKEDITVTNRGNDDRLHYLEVTYGIKTTRNTAELINTADIIFLTFKPKDVADGMTLIRDYVKDGQLLISVLAGISTECISQLLGKNNPIIRAMPNTSAAIGKSATGIASCQHATDSHLALATSIFETVGIVAVVQEEELHAVTGLSGSGPAYVYYLVEAMEKAALQIGLEPTTAKDLILQTIIGAAEMLQQSSKSPSQLRKDVTSQGGTTEAGINTLESYQYEEAMIRCIKNATTRSKELGEILAKSIY